MDKICPSLLGSKLDKICTCRKANMKYVLSTANHCGETIKASAMSAYPTVTRVMRILQKSEGSAVQQSDSAQVLFAAELSVENIAQPFARWCNLLLECIAYSSVLKNDQLQSATHIDGQSLKSCRPSPPGTDVKSRRLDAV